jgi:hypothetical protein
MPQEEIFGTRDKSYSAWHRRLSVCRYVGIERAQTLAMIDLDAALYVEYDDASKEPLALIETAVDCGQEWKAGTVIGKLAERANIPAYVLLYRLADTPNPAAPEHMDIVSFRVRSMWPHRTEWKDFTAAEWAEKLVEIRAWSARRLDTERQKRKAADAA